LPAAPDTTKLWLLANGVTVGQLAGLDELATMRRSPIDRPERFQARRSETGPKSDGLASGVIAAVSLMRREKPTMWVTAPTCGPTSTSDLGTSTGSSPRGVGQRQAMQVRRVLARLAD
jgi:hypothetical protein